MKLYCKTCGKKTDVDLLIKLVEIGGVYYKGSLVPYADIDLKYQCGVCGNIIKKSNIREIYLDNTYSYVEFEDV